MKNASVNVRPAKPRAERPWFLLAFLAGHVPLAIVIHAWPMLGAAHALACLVGGLGYAAATKRIRNVALIVAYIAGGEVLWRMTKTPVPWEFGKYACAAILLVAVIRLRAGHNRVLIGLYFGLLLPSAALTFAALDLGLARNEVSFNLSGPFAVAGAALFFSNIRLTGPQLRNVFFAIIGPVLGIMTLAVLSTLARSTLEFFNASNSATSGGFGPNQVSAMLGLAVLLLLLLSLDRRLSWRERGPLIALAAALAAQSALTFARGGLLLAGTGMAGAVFFYVSGGLRSKLTVVLVSLVSVALARFVIEPRLDDISGGKLSERFSNTKSTGRDKFIESELLLFRENPLMGVGPGVGFVMRDDMGLIKGASHTEYTRMLAEHGLLGALSLICLIGLAVRAIKGAKTSEARGIATALVFWFATFLMIYGLRLAAPAIVFGIALALRPSPKPVSKNQPGNGAD